MTQAKRSEIVVIGGGVVGLAAALTLQQRGRRVLLIDRDTPGAGCSWGNAAVIASSFVLPLSDVGHILAAPRMLLDPLGPLAIRGRDLMTTAPWLGRFALNALPSRQRRTIDALKLLNARAVTSWRSLLAGIGQSHAMAERGMLEVVRGGAVDHEASLRRLAARLGAEGIAVTWLDAKAVAELEPVLAGRVGAGILHRDVAHVSDPAIVSASLLNGFLSLGGKFLRAEIERLVPMESRVRLCFSGDEIVADRLIVAAGYRSRDMLTPLGCKVPIGVERGYHQMVEKTGPLIDRPISFHREAFLATPIGNQLRLAGTVELAAIDAPPAWKRAEQLVGLASRYLPGLAAVPGSRWMGARPSFPDGLPAIGSLEGIPQISYAFGHQHLGLTQAAVTADALCCLLAGRGAPFDLMPFSLGRFDRPFSHINR
ncbi:FAD-binding oxidoreductase [Sphingopyxis sp. JAI128]|uniref:NAD(P)/FAD-dependent oxidoreductase n=1 Tax=Sphingopyxis sp. JAI128 TaxID=2723066 RepID=UPI0016175F27|nr:FAD-binding oxidoreductase [Sphingopyxis sp. JAI128]MBB6428157.1 D-amino-acid dehydrogenase [Sphingopyxis sp. JAI128]